MAKPTLCYGKESKVKVKTNPPPRKGLAFVCHPFLLLVLALEGLKGLTLFGLDLDLGFFSVAEGVGLATGGGVCLSCNFRFEMTHPVFGTFIRCKKETLATC